MRAVCPQSIMTKYHLTNEQKESINDLMRELLHLCQIYQVPMFATAAVTNDENGTESLNCVYGAGANNIVLTDDHIRKHILVESGFEVAPKREVRNINFEDVLRLQEKRQGEKK